MKRFIIFCLLVFSLLPITALASVISPAHIKHLDGDVMFRTPDDDEWLPASVNTPLDEGDAIWCSTESRAEIQLSDGSVLRLDSGTQLDVVANEEGFIHLHLASGRLYLKTAQTIDKDSLQIDADDTTVLPSARTRLRLDMLPYGQEDVTIFKGSAYVEGNGSRTRVRAGEHIALEEGFNELLPLNPPDEWERWNTARDRQLSRSTRQDSYLPDELRNHAAELDSNGTWVRVPDYGMVWRPTVILSSDWAPYRSGRWIWKNGDYVWISFESWGWVPYHYGRWTVVSGYGWCWVPPLRGDVYWGPGYVGWYSTGNHVGWTPLAPGETYYGRRHYGRHSAIVSSVRINPATIEYRNRRHAGGLTIVQHTDFQRGRIIVQPPARTPSLSVSVSIGAPAIRPLRETRMPIVKQTPPRVAPPRIERFERRDLRERFPRVTTEAGRDRRGRQPQVPVAPQAVPVQTTPVKEKRTVFPVTEPVERSKGSAGPPPGEHRKRDGDRQRSPVIQQQPASGSVTAPQKGEAPRRENDRQRTPAQPSVQPPSAPTPVPAVVPSRQDQPRREAAPPVQVPQPAGQPSQQGERGARDEQRQRQSVQPPPQPSQQPARPLEQRKPAASEPVRHRGERAPDEIREKKIWRVTTPDAAPERDGKENRERGRRER